MDTISTGAPTQYDDAMTWLYLVGMAAVWQYTQTATEDERVIYILCMIEYSTIDGRNTHLIAIVAHTVDDPAGDTPGRQDDMRQFLDWSIQWPKAEHISAGNWLRGYTQHIANDAAHACICSTERLNRRRMIVRLDLKGDVVRFCEADDTGVVTEG